MKTSEKQASEKKKGRLEALERKLLTPATPPTFRASASSSPLSFASPGRRRSHDVGENYGTTYAELCPSVLNGPLSSHLQLSRVSDANGVVNDVIRNLLEGNANFTGDVGGMIDSRIQDTTALMLDNPPTQDRSAGRARQRAERTKRSKQHLSLRQHRKLGSYELPEEFRKYSLYQPLQEMWLDHMKDLLADCNDTMMHSRMLSADLHGATLAVVDCKSSTYVGTQGIMVRETENTFGIITPENKFRVIPKAGTIFRLEVNKMVVTLFGDNLVLRSLAKRGKPKLKNTIEL